MPVLEERRGVRLAPLHPGFTWGNSPETGGAMPDRPGGASRDLPPNARGAELQNGSSLLSFSLSLISLSYSHLQFYV